MKVNRAPLYSVLLLNSFALFLILPIIFFLIFKSHFFPYLASAPVHYKWFIFVAVMIAFPLGQCIGVPFIGSRSDYIRGKPLFLIALLGETLGLFFSFLALYYKSLNTFIISRLFTGFFTANFALCFSYLASSTNEPSMLKKVMGRATLSIVAGFMVAIFIATFFSDANLGNFTDPRIAFLLATFLGLVNTAIILFSKNFLLSQKVLPHPSISLLAKLKTILKQNYILRKNGTALLFLLLCISAPLSFFSSIIFGIYTLNKTWLMALLLIIGGVWILGFVTNLKYKSFSNNALVLFFSALSALALALSFAPSFTVFIICFAGFQFFASLLSTNLFSQVVMHSPSDARGLCIGFAQSLGFLAAAIAPILALFLMISPSPVKISNLFIVSFLFSILGAAYLLFSKRAIK
ncbi:hypothetical protein COB21_03520 [Candidatus Aerophobetes bacterium]|uniref:Major facilitator superfamily (MFS) profile domain-containing protein n=1 Tax=Aerophobetes bacterium TaxID=2030807 RepID=A0A2A4X3G8_UNCAE|nr:MAG: hypothetical protein COB21_03520 [Candidatus Aerophobetes bacterium]